MTEHDFIRNISGYDPKKVNNEQLADDWRIVNAWYSTYKQTDGKGIKHSREDIVNLAKIIYDEIVSRVKQGKMKHEFNPEQMKSTSKELYQIVSKGKEVPMQTFEKQMNIKLLGTGPTNPIPRKECDCELCKEARKKGSKSKRTQSSILINNKLLVDATPSIEEQMEGLDPKIEAILITHAHSDAISGLKKVDKYLANRTVPVYTFKHTIKLIKQIIGEKDYLEFHEVEPYQRLKIVDFTVVPYPVEHSILEPHYDPTISWKINSIIYAEDIDEEFFLSEKSDKLKKSMKDAKIVFLDGALCKGKLAGHINIWHIISHLKNKGIENVYFIQVGHSCPPYEKLVEQIKTYSPGFKITYDGMEIKAPISFAEMHHIYLVPPHAEMIWKGEKNLIVKSRDFPGMVGKSLILCDDRYEYGIIVLRPSYEIDMQKFEELKVSHKITDEERKKWWPEKDLLYAYDYHWEERYENPKPFKAPEEAQTFFEFKDEKNVISHFKDMKIIKNFISIAGSFVDNEGKKYNDIDMVVRLAPPHEFIRRAIEARYLKDLPKDISDKIHLVFDPEGPHSTHIPLYDLVMIRTESKLVEMSRNLTLMQPYLPQKPYGSAYYLIDDIMKQIKEGVEYCVEYKYNGFHVGIHKQGDEVKIYSEQKKDLTKAFPTLAEAIKKISPKDFVVDGEIVPYEDSKPLGRNVLMKYIQSKGEKDDSNIKLHLWDILYYG